MDNSSSSGGFSMGGMFGGGKQGGGFGGMFGGRDGDRSGGRQGIGRTKVIVAVTVFITAVVAATRTAVPKGTLLVEYGGRAQELPLDRLELAAVQGTVVNGRGEERTVDGPVSRSFQRSLSRSVTNTVRGFWRRKSLSRRKSI